MKPYLIYICKKCKWQLSEDIMGKTCPYCSEWTYHIDCEKEVILKEEFSKIKKLKPLTSKSKIVEELEQLKEEIDKYKWFIERHVTPRNYQNIELMKNHNNQLEELKKKIEVLK